MRRSISNAVVLVMLFAAGVVFGADAGQAVSKPSADGSKNFTVNASILYSGGDAGFQIGQFGFVLSELVYPVEGWLGEVRAEYKIPCGVISPAIRGRFAKSIVTEGTSTDSDWTNLIGPATHYSESDSAADIQMLDADAVLYLNRSLLGRFELGVLAGYGKQTFNYEDSNLEATYLGESFSVPGVNSTYDLDFSMWRVGVLASYYFTDKFSMGLEGILLPGLTANSDALWVLRNYPFQQQADGMGYSVDLKMRYALRNYLQLLAGARYVSLIADSGGTESGFQEETGPYYDWEIVPQMTSEYYAFEVGASLGF